MIGRKVEILSSALFSIHLSFTFVRRQLTKSKKKWNSSFRSKNYRLMSEFERLNGKTN